jgi:hypothetical protein
VPLAQDDAAIDAVAPGAPKKSSAHFPFEANGSVGELVLMACRFRLIRILQIDSMRFWKALASCWCRAEMRLDQLDVRESLRQVSWERAICRAPRRRDGSNRTSGGRLNLACDQGYDLNL